MAAFGRDRHRHKPLPTWSVACADEGALLAHRRGSPDLLAVRFPTHGADPATAVRLSVEESRGAPLDATLGPASSEQGGRDAEPQWGVTGARALSPSLVELDIGVLPAAPAYGRVDRGVGPPVDRETSGGAAWLCDLPLEQHSSGAASPLVSPLVPSALAVAGGSGGGAATLPEGFRAAISPDDALLARDFELDVSGRWHATPAARGSDPDDPEGDSGGDPEAWRGRLLPQLGSAGVDGGWEAVVQMQRLGSAAQTTAARGRAGGREGGREGSREGKEGYSGRKGGRQAGRQGGKRSG